MEKFRSKGFNLVLYPEDEKHAFALEKIKQSYDYACILHDMDIDENGVIKKLHYHIVITFKNAKWNTALAKELEITENYIQEARSVKRSLLYLIHYYDEDKYQYKLDQVTGPLKNRLEIYMSSDSKTESEKVLDMLDEIDTFESKIDYCLFIKHIAKIGYWDVLRRSSSLIMRYIDLHNQEYEL